MWDGSAALEVAPSPKSQAYATIVPSASDEPLPVNATSSGAVPDVGDAVAVAVGAWLPPPEAVPNEIT